MKEEISVCPGWFVGHLSDYLELTKPRLVALALATTLLGFFTGSGASPDLGMLIRVLLGAGLVGAGANALNQFLERETDAKMKRTENRPIPSGRLNARSVLIFGFLMSLTGVIFLALFVNPLTAFLGAAAVTGYVGFYTPLKSRTPFCTFVGAIPGALPSMMGWTAARSQLDPEAWVLFAILFAWQLPHFFAIAWVHREDYQRSGLRVFFSKATRAQGVALQILLGSGALFLVSLAPVVLAGAGEVYFFAAVTAGSALMAFAVFMWRNHLVHARYFVRASIYYLVVIILFMMADKV